MKNEIITKGKVDQEGKITFVNKALFFDNISNKFVGKEIELIARKKVKTRSNPQIAYYFGVVIPMIQSRLYELHGERYGTDKLDNDFRITWLCDEEVNTVTGEIQTKVLSLKEVAAEVDTTTMMLFIENIRQWAARDIDLNIPDPDPNYKYNNQKT